MTTTFPSDEPLVRQRVAAHALNVSASYLRASDCPKVLLPGNGPKGQKIVRYRMSDVWKWVEGRTRRKVS